MLVRIQNAIVVVESRLTAAMMPCNSQALRTNELLVAAGLPTLIFVAADDDLIAATHAEGVPAENPNQHP